VLSLQGPRALLKADAVGRFGNFELVGHHPDRGPSNIAAESGHPLLGCMNMLREKLAGDSAFSRAVAFGNLGGPAQKAK
jgi:hypothetical protein